MSYMTSVASVAFGRNSSLSQSNVLLYFNRLQTLSQVLLELLVASESDLHVKLRAG